MGKFLVGTTCTPVNPKLIEIKTKNSQAIHILYASEIFNLHLSNTHNVEDIYNDINYGEVKTTIPRYMNVHIYMYTNLQVLHTRVRFFIHKYCSIFVLLMSSTHI